MTRRYPLLLLPILLSMLAVPAGAQLRNPMKYVIGALVDSAGGGPVDGGRVFVWQEGVREPVTSIKINSADGHFKALLDPETTYRFEIVTPAFYRTNILYTTPGEMEYEEIDTVFRLRRIPIGEVIYRGRLFEAGSSNLINEESMKKAIEFMNVQPNVNFTVAVAAEVPPPPKPAAKPPKSKKKGKGKGKEAEPPPSEPPPPPAVDPVRLLSERTAVVKNLFKAAGVNITRFTWKEAEPGSPGGTDNVMVTVSSIGALDDLDD